MTDRLTFDALMDMVEKDAEKRARAHIMKCIHDANRALLDGLNPRLSEIDLSMFEPSLSVDTKTTALIYKSFMIAAQRKLVDRLMEGGRVSSPAPIHEGPRGSFQMKCN